MKRKLLFLASLLSASMVLTACGGTGEGGEGGGGSGINLPNTAEEAVNKFYQFANSTGFEITYKTYDDESAQPDVNTVGFKNNTFWVKEEVAYKKDGNKLEMYEYDADKGTYEFQSAVTETEQASLDAMLKSFTAVFYAGYDYASQPVGSFTSKTDVTFLGRAASEYTFTYLAGTASATLKIVFDNATGITLKIYGSASDSTGSSSAEFEVTSFTFGEAVRVPTLNKSSGQGGGGEGGGEGGGGQQDVDYFSNKLLVYVSHQNANMYVNSTLALFDDGKFELSFQESNFLVVKLGEYSVGENKTLATLNVKKVYKDRSQEYSSMNETLSLSYADGGYALQVSTSGKVNYIASGQSPVHADIPEEGGQTGDDAKYKVTETQWNNMIVNRGLISLTSNFTMITTNSNNQEKYEFDNGKVHYTSAINEVFYEFTSLTSGYVYHKSNGQWQKGAADGMHQLFDDSIGVLPVPYNKVSFNSDSHYYGCSQWTTVGADNQQDSYQNARFYFEDNNLMKTSYKRWDVDYLYNYSKHGQTTVTLPQTGGQTDTNARYKVTSQVYEDMIIDGGLIGLDSNFTAMVRSSDNQNGYTMYEFDEGNIRVYSVDPDGTTNEYFAEYTNTQNGFEYYKNESGVWSKENTSFGIGTYLNSLGILPIPFSSLTFNESTREYDLASWTNNYGTRFSDIHFSFDNNKLLKTRYQGPYASAEVEINKYGTTSVTLPEVGGGGGGEQEESKWPTEDIANKLATLGINVTVPDPGVDNEYIVSVTDEITADNASLLITVTLTDATYSAVVFSSFIDGFQDEFSLDYPSSDIDNGIYVLMNETRDIALTLTYLRTSNVVTLLISQYKGNPYPAEAIAAFIGANNLKTAFPSLEMENVSYTLLSTDESSIIIGMEPLNNNTNANILAKAAEVLVRGGFKVCYMPTYDGTTQTLYIDPAVEYCVSFQEYEGTLYAFISLGGDEMADDIDVEYPTTKIAALTPEYVNDELPSLEVRGAVYMVGEDDYGFLLQIHLQPGMASANVMRQLSSTLTTAGYQPNDDEGYVAPNGSIEVYISNIDDKIIQVEVLFPEPQEPEEVTYTIVCDNNWDITVDNAVIYAYMWKANGEYQWVELSPEKAEDNTISFTLETDSSWVGMKIVRFSPESEIAWKYGPEGSVNENVTIWNETGDIELNQKGGVVNFSFPS